MTSRRRLVGTLLFAGLGLGLTLGPGGAAAASTVTTTTSSSASHHLAPAPAVLSGWLSSGAAFPRRALVLGSPAGRSLAGARLHVTENGTPVSALAVTSLADPGRGDAAVLVAVDESASMATSLPSVFGAVSALATARPAREALGVIGFGKRATALLSPTTRRITPHAPSVTAQRSRRADLTAATALGLRQLRGAGSAFGALVVISDGVDLSATRASAAAAVSANVPVITIGLRTPSASAAGLAALRRWAPPGRYLTATPASLPGTLSTGVAVLLGGYEVARYRSSAAAGAAVTVHATASGTSGTLTASYTAPGRARHPTAAGRASPPTQHTATSPATATAPAAPATTAPTATAPAATAPVATAPAASSTATTATSSSATPAHRAGHSTPAHRAGHSAPAHRAGHPAPTHRAGHPTHHTATPPATVPLPTSSVIPVATAPAGGFWQSGVAVLVIAGTVALLIGAIIMLLLQRPGGRAVRTRVGSYLPVEEFEFDGVAVGQAKRSGLRDFVTHSSWWHEFEEAVEVSRNPRSAGYVMKRAAIVAVLLAPLVWLLIGHPVVALLPLVLFPFVERWWVKRAAQKQRVTFGETLPSYMQDMASAIRVGRSFVNAMGLVADSADEPTRSEFERAVTDESLGRPLEASLIAVGQRMRSADIDQIALIAELNRRSGSNVAEALDRVAEGARDRADLRREASALTAQAKMSSSVLTGLPVVVLLALSVIAPSYAHPLFHTTFGIVALVFAVLLITSGWKVMQKIAKVEV